MRCSQAAFLIIGAALSAAGCAPERSRPDAVLTLMASELAAIRLGPRTVNPAIRRPDLGAITGLSCPHVVGALGPPDYCERDAGLTDDCSTAERIGYFFFKAPPYQDGDTLVVTAGGGWAALMTCSDTGIVVTAEWMLQK